MVRALRPHEHRADVEIEVFKFLDLDVARQFGERHGKIGAFHLAGQRVEQPFARTPAAEDAQPAARIVNRREKRQALDVVPMRVRDEQRDVQRLVFEFRQQREAERAQTRARVENDDFTAAADFDAGSVAAVAHGGRPRRRNRTAHAPELYASASFDEATLARLWRKTNGKTLPGCRGTEQSEFDFHPLEIAGLYFGVRTHLVLEGAARIFYQKILEKQGALMQTARPYGTKEKIFGRCNAARNNVRRGKRLCR